MSSSASPEQRPPDTVIAYAQQLHDNIVRELGGHDPSISAGSGAAFEDHQATYNGRLFTGLALQLAGVEVPPDASATERSRLIAQALHCISTTPHVFERVTGIPYDTQFVDEITESRASQAAQEAQQAEALREKVARYGHLTRGMVPSGTLQLRYAVPPRGRGFMRREQPTKEFTLRLRPTSNRIFTIRQYKRALLDNHGHPTSFFDYTGNDRTVDLIGLFDLAAVTSASGHTNRKLSNVVGSYVRFGQISPDAPLRFDHSFTMPGKEVRGREQSDPDHKTYTLKGSRLVQAYLGHTARHPLFPM